ncbi:MAG: AlwI family type II restriction endonuclease [Bifidobacteriaceae bacterium]|jgi:hypothetical protein|nr:AlwI family type II restriction endonuclease [Bifidobacteriaceae bacterium]
MSHILKEGLDDYIRKMRATGIISLRDAGNYVDIDSLQSKKADYIIKTYSEMPSSFATDLDYFKYASAKDEELFTIISESHTEKGKAQLLDRWVDELSHEAVRKELIVLTKVHNSKDELLKLIPAPARLEFLISIYTKQSFPEVTVIPQYSMDDEGLPRSTAAGNVADIKCFENNNAILIEVTMATGRNQTVMEGGPVARHLRNEIAKETANRKVMVQFVAPSIYPDTKEYFRFLKHNDKLNIKTKSVQEYIAFCGKSSTLFES